jgi:competence protein ComEC
MFSSRNKILIFLLSFLTGVFLAPDFVYLKNSIYFFIIIFLLSFFIVKNNYIKFLLIIFVGTSLGLLLFSFAKVRTEYNIKSYADNSEVVIFGYVSSYPQEKEKNISFILNSEGQKIYILVPKINNYFYGQKIKIIGKINKIENEDEFNFKDYFLSKDISYQIFYPKVVEQGGTDGNSIINFLFKIRKLFEDKTNEIFVKPYSSFVLGILLGVKSLSKDLMDMFSKVSLSHIIVVSGYNLSIIAEVLKKIFYPTSRRLSFWLPMSGIWIFTFLVGADAPVVRAAVMASVIIFSRKEGKKSDGVAVLILAAVLMILFNPFILRYDPGFQLSFLSTLGIILYCDKIEHLLSIIKLPKLITEVASATFSAQIFILPIIAFYFGRVSILGPLANLIVLPLIPIIMFFSFINIIIGFVNLSLAHIFSHIPIILILFCIKAGYFLSEIKFAFFEINFNINFVLIYFILLIIVHLIFKNAKTKKS